MRKNFIDKVGTIAEYTAEFSFYSSRNGGTKIDKALLTNIRDREGNFITDHVWISTKYLDIFLQRGDKIKFLGLVSEYTKTSKNRICSKTWKDYAFKEIGDIKIVN